MRRGAILWTCLALAAGCSSKPAPPALTVSAASDLTNAFREIGESFERDHGVKVEFNFGSSGNLARQIEQGAPVDVFASADQRYIDELVAQGHLDPATQALYARGRLVWWQPADAATPIGSLADLAKPEIRRVAIANPAHAPYGAAAKQTLESLDLWDEVEPKLVIGENIRQAFQYAETGNAEVGLVALSMCRPGVGRWELAPAELHQPLNQALAVSARSKQPSEARKFAEYVNGPKGRAILVRYGLTLPGEELPPEMTRSRPPEPAAP